MRLLLRHLKDVPDLDQRTKAQRLQRCLLCGKFSLLRIKMTRFRQPYPLRLLAKAIPSARTTRMVYRINANRKLTSTKAKKMVALMLIAMSRVVC